MPIQYEKIKASYLKSGKSEKEAKRLASMTFIAHGKGGDRSSRAKSLHEGIDYTKRKGAAK
jgi:hypothetical protein